MNDDAEIKDRKQVNVRFPVSLYTEMEDATGRTPDKQYRSISELVRYAVARELEEEGETAADTGSGATVDMSPLTDDVLPTLERIESQIDELDDRLRALEREEEAETGIDLQRILLEILPAADEIEDPADDGLTVSELSQRTGASPDEIREALDGLNDRRSRTIVADDPVDPHAPEDYEHPTVYYRSEQS